MQYNLPSLIKYTKGPPRSWLFGCWIYNYLCNQCLSPLSLWVRIPHRRGVLDKVCQWLAAGRLFSPGTPVSSTNKTDRHDITEILLKVALNTITLTPNPILYLWNLRLLHRMFEWSSDVDIWFLYLSSGGWNKDWRSWCITAAENKTNI